MAYQKTFGSWFKPIPLKEQKKLPAPVLEWIQEQKRFRGVFEFRLQKHTYVLIALGQRPNPGYRLEMVKVESGPEGTDVLIEEKLPLRGRMYPQVVVYPYIVAQVQGKIRVWLVRPDQSLVRFP
ncbi:protease complex subunit PrcB family protein [Lihuaxuella thermophila]|uniref:PrcB C-terminal n=1 Tax=Lihuaxuella thermophila TaxID=1173111 RepID=A0A1H8EY36_9BACL|nr:protease complex subunit PrcB family protein [Lihuaxuella thermophila]SEN23787.1 PrcB C-terminal [Lihuaxuella thermophila]